MEDAAVYITTHRIVFVDKMHGQCNAPAHCKTVSINLDDIEHVYSERSGLLWTGRLACCITASIVLMHHSFQDGRRFVARIESDAETITRSLKKLTKNIYSQ